MNPVIAAAAYLLLNGQVIDHMAPPVAVAIDCQLTGNMTPFEDEAHPHHVRHANHLTIRWRHPAPPPRHRPHHHHG